MKQRLAFLVLALVVLLPVKASALIGSRNLAPDVRARTVCLGEHAVRAATDISEGINGVLSAATINATAAPTDTVIATMRHPAKLMVILDDDTNSADTLTCTSVALVGRDMWGKKVSETVSTITETASESSYVYSVLESVTGAGCAGANDANDVLVIYEGQEIGIGLDVDHYTDVESACLVDASDSNNVKCAYPNDASAADIESAVDTSANTIDLSVAMFGASSKVAAADGDTVCFRVRP